MARIAAWFASLSTNGKRGVIGGGIASVLALVVGVVAIAGGGGSDEVKQTARSTTTTTTTTTSTTAVPTTTQPDKGPVAPLTGLRVKDGALLARPPLAVKIDNLDAARESAVPQTGLIRADLVYEEIVEANITRLVGVFHSQQPERVGPVRSARTTDVNLLPQLGRPLLAFSGGNNGVLAAVAGSPSIVDVGANRVPGAYHRDHSRRAPHNLYVDGNSLWSHAPKGLPAPPQLFLFRTPGQAPPAGTPKSQGVDLTWGGGGASSPVQWRWDPKARLYLRFQRGRAHRDSSGVQLSAKNVLVLVTTYGQSAADSRSPEAQTVGSGEAFVYTTGRVIHGRWNRPAIDKPTSVVDDAGRPVFFSPGQTWIELPRAGGVTTVR